VETFLELFFKEGPNLAVLVAGLLIVLSLFLVLKIFNFALTLVKSIREIDNKKVDHLATAMERNTTAIIEMSAEMKQFNQRIADTDFSTLQQEAGHRRLVAIVKELAGEQWTEIQRKVREDEFIHGEKK
jgi:hypothetical protein